ncbi:RimK family protein [Salinisphaera sp. P385]|uniref:RimK family protein n=1 Tax=Spectribacter acetivorans TaxID=3075603 RepID=A0ABU3B4L6_9GAMM|nr:RimK family protein [Salinisphaera sp. P385]MDT0617055.1 RimK family protein [Salinisphaera sp. P385]
MAEAILVVESPRDWRAAESPARVVAADDYLTDPAYATGAFHVINLCRSVRYQSTGYYCSLLAEARGHRVIPSVATIQDLSRKALYGYEIPALSALLDKLPVDRRVALPRQLHILFGQTTVPGFEELARQAFGAFPAPLLELEISSDRRLAVTALRSLAPRALTDGEHEDLPTALSAYMARGRRSRRRRDFRFDVAILVDPAEAQPPSDRGALRRFASVGRELGLDVEFIGARDFGRLAEFDALFIRETTRLGHHTYRFARRAEQLGLVVIDDPRSILRCTNKVYLAELLAANRIPAPRTAIFGEREITRLPDMLGFPMVLKAPEGAFSKGVFKVDNTGELAKRAAELLDESELALAQEFVPTEFDWRVGVLNRQALYVCQYEMAAAHWQIVKHESDGKFQEGGFRTLGVEAAPADVVRTAVKAANLIGDGLYGVDLKQTAQGLRLIEINDNPSIDRDVEDAVLGNELYRRIMAEFLRRLESRGQRRRPTP